MLCCRIQFQCAGDQKAGEALTPGTLKNQKVIRTIPDYYRTPNLFDRIKPRNTAIRWLARKSHRPFNGKIILAQAGVAICEDGVMAP